MSVIKIKKCGTKNSKQEKDSFIKIMENLLKKKYERHSNDKVIQTIE